jgi:hypothetical protein
MVIRGFINIYPDANHRSRTGFQWTILLTKSSMEGMRAAPDDKPPIEWAIALLILFLACLLVGAILWMKYATDAP